jgi:hypothetical protein
MDSQYFIQNNHILYEMNNEFHDQVLNRDSRSRKVAIKIHNNDDVKQTQSNNDVENTEIVFDDIETLDNLDVVFEKPTLQNIAELQNIQNQECLTEVSDFNVESTDINDISIINNDSTINNETKMIIDKTNSSESGSTTCSSRTSHTSNSGSMDGDEESDDGSDMSYSDDDASSSSGSTASEDKALINIYDYPVNAILLEKCENTLDYLCDCDDDFDSEQLCAALMQVIMTLIAFHKCFDFQHNDLHTNNIMYVLTQKQFLYYKVNDTYYKVPTYGRIFKIIDFGRATYKFRGNQFCSDSFHVDGDAHTQFNFGRHYNPSRPILEPNNSFDLCRLGTSLIDFLIEEVEEIEEAKDPVVIMVCEWCKDDQGRNVLWKSNGDERYPGFKLYKMITRTVSKHKPVMQLERPILERYKCARKNIKKSTTVMNIDALPSYVSADACGGSGDDGSGDVMTV